MPRKRSWLIPVLALLLASFTGVLTATTPSPNQRLILKDGSYQIVKQYKVSGGRVSYLSAERGDWEEMPSDLVDWTATGKWAKEHPPGALSANSPSASAGNSEAAEIDREEQQDRAAQGASSPEVAANLYLPGGEGVWALDIYHGQPELVALAQNSGSANQRTVHNVLRTALNSLGGPKQDIEIPGASSKIRLHVTDPAIYVSLTTNDGDLARSGAVKDKKSSSSPKSTSSPASQYAIVRIQSNPRRDDRAVSGLKIGMRGEISGTEEIQPATAEILPGNDWMKLTPRQPLPPGEYALMEILAPGQVNASVWDFGVDPQAPENQDALRPVNRALR